MSIRVALMTAALVGLAGCSVFLPKLVPPRLSIVSISLEKSDLFTQHLDVRMHVENPNDRSLPVQGLSYTLDIGGVEAARGASSASFTVPAMGDAEFDMEVTANMAGTFFRLFAGGGSRTDRFDYRIVGKVKLSHGLLRSIPFQEHGSFALR